MRKDDNKLKPFIYSDIKCTCESTDHECILEYQNDSEGMFGDVNEEYGCEICDHGTSITIVP